MSDDEVTYYATIDKGRSAGVLHLDRNCHYIRDVDDEDVMSGPRERYADDQDVCRLCGDSDG